MVVHSCGGSAAGRRTEYGHGVRRAAGPAKLGLGGPTGRHASLLDSGPTADSCKVAGFNENQHGVYAGLGRGAGEQEIEGETGSGHLSIAGAVCCRTTTTLLRH